MFSRYLNNFSGAIKLSKEVFSTPDIHVSVMLIGKASYIVIIIVYCPLLKINPRCQSHQKD